MTKRRQLVHLITLAQQREALGSLAKRAHHHGKHVDKIVVTLAITVLKHADQGSIRMMETASEWGFGFTARAKFHGTEYRFTYEHPPVAKISVKDGNRVVKMLDNSTPLDEIQAFIKSL